MSTRIAHIVGLPANQTSSATVWALCIMVAVCVLTVRHLFVKYPRNVALRRLRFHIGLATLVAVVAAASPGPAAASQPAPAIGLPDLVSYPPIIWFDKLVTDDNGETQKVLAFDGYLYNIGDGMLDFVGNPQEVDGMKQRVFDGTEWTEVGSVTVRYESNDDHNHFHLNAAAEYQLWNEGQTTAVNESAKVGFCLLDTEQVEPRRDALYDIAAFNYCEQDNPDATDMRMGISPGWVDTYDANTTLQWVDITSVSPGRYWMGAIIDPLNQVVESNEDNNDVVFSSNKWSISGYVARPLPTQVAGEPIVLKASVFGEVRDPIFQIVTGPSNGTLSVPVGVDLATRTVTYWPEPDSDGTDEFSYVVRDRENYYPKDPATATVVVDAAGFSAPPRNESGAQDLSLSIDSPGFGSTLEVTRYRAVDEPAFTTTTDGTDEPESVRWFASGLPGGLSIDETTGEIGGVATVEGSGSATITVMGSADATTPTPNTSIATLPIEWVVVDAAPSMHDVDDISTAADVEARLFVGAGTAGAVYTAVGLPPGVNAISNLPQLAGAPLESGVYEVVVTETVDGVETATTEFRWTVRPKRTPAFPL